MWSSVAHCPRPEETREFSSRAAYRAILQTHRMTKEESMLQHRFYRTLMVMFLGASALWV